MRTAQTCWACGGAADQIDSSPVGNGWPVCQSCVDLMAWEPPILPDHLERDTRTSYGEDVARLLPYDMHN